MLGQNSNIQCGGRGTSSFPDLTLVPIPLSQAGGGVGGGSFERGPPPLRGEAGHKRAVKV